MTTTALANDVLAPRARMQRLLLLTPGSKGGFVALAPQATPRVLVWDARNGQLALAETNGEALLRVTTIELDRRPHALVAPLARGMRLLRNGVRAPALIVLGSGDELWLGPFDLRLFATVELAPWIGPADAELGRTCPVCRVPIERGQRIWICARCATPMHAEGEEKPAAERLECMQLVRECRACSAVVRAERSLEHAPEEP